MQYRNNLVDKQSMKSFHYILATSLVLSGFLGSEAYSKNHKSKKSKTHKSSERRASEKSKKGGKRAKVASSSSASHSESETYCTAAADDILSLNGLGSFEEPKGKKVRVSKGAGFRFFLSGMKKDEGVFVYPKFKKYQIEVVRFDSGSKEPSRVWFEVNKKCKVSKIWGNDYGKQPRIAVTRRGCQLVSQELERAPASAYPVSRLTFQDKTKLGRKKVEKEWRSLMRAGVKGPYGAFDKVRDLCISYSETFPNWKQASGYESSGQSSTDYGQDVSGYQSTSPSTYSEERTPASADVPAAPEVSAPVPTEGSASPKVYGPTL